MSKNQSEEMPQLSAVISVHNEEDKLEACLERLRFADEIVVVLDRCTDGTRTIAEKFTDQIRPVCATQALICSNCAGDVHPGLSLITSIPCCIALIARCARSDGMADTNAKSAPQSNAACRLSKRGKCGKRLRNPGRVSG